MSLAPRSVGAASGEFPHHVLPSSLPATARPPEAQAQRLGVVVVAAGQSRRMAGVDKIFAPLLGVALIAHAVEALEACSIVSELVLVLSPDKIDLGEGLATKRGWSKVTSICPGGRRRQDSVRLGLERLSPCSWVAVHDGARPCIRADLLERGMAAAQETGAAVAAVPVKDTIKVVDSSGIVESTPHRDRLWMVQTPQIFRYDLLLLAHRDCHDTVTDDAAMVESLGHKVQVFMGSYSNLKVTTPQDIAIAEALLKMELCPEGAKQDARANVGSRWLPG